MGSWQEARHICVLVDCRARLTDLLATVVIATVCSRYCGLIHRSTRWQRTTLIHPAVGTDFGVGRVVVHRVLSGAGVPLGEDSCKVRIGLLDTVQHGSERHILKGRFEVKSNKDPGVVSCCEVLKVLIIVFAPSGLPTPYCKGPAHLATDSFFAAITDLSASLRRKDIMRSGLWPPVGLASGVICQALRYCRTE